MSEDRTPTGYIIKMIELSTGNTKEVPRPKDRTLCEALRYVNDLNVHCLTYGTVYILELTYE